MPKSRGLERAHRGASATTAIIVGRVRDEGSSRGGAPLKHATAFLLAGILLATAAVAIVGQTAIDPLAPYRASDGTIRIPGGALTPDLQRLLFGGKDLEPYLNLSHYIPARSPYATMQLVPTPIYAPNLNVFTRSKENPVSLAAGVAHAVSRWFAPVDWGASLSRIANGFFGFLSMDARAVVVVDQTITATTGGATSNTCTTSQTAAGADNAVIVLLTERGTTTYATVSYGSANLTLIAGAFQNGGAVVRTEIWGFVGVIPSGIQTMTATLSGAATAKQTCATVLLQGVSTTGSFVNGTGSNGTTANASVTLTAAVGSGDLAFAVLVMQGTANPTAVTGTGATATSLYGTAVALCTSGNPPASNVCGAGADLPNPGTALTWTSVAATWAIAAVEVAAGPGCGVGGGNCYRIGSGGTWGNGAFWSNLPGGPGCGCTPSSTDTAIFNATPTGITSLSAATTIANIDMTGFTGTLDTTSGPNWSLTVNGGFTIQGTFLANSSIITVTGNVAVTAAAAIVTMSTSTWTVNGTWTNNSTSASWSAGTSAVTIRDAVSGTLTFASLAGGANEFNNLTLDASVVAGLTYTQVNALRAAGVVTIQNTAGGATGAVVLDASISNYGSVTGGLALGTLSGYFSRSASVTVNGSVNFVATGYATSAITGTWSVTGAWTNGTTSGAWSFAASITFRSTANRTMTFKAAATEFGGAVTFDTTAVAGVTYTMGTNALTLAGLLTVQNSVGIPTGNTILDTSVANLGITAGGVTVGTNGTLRAQGSAIAVGGNWTVTAANATFTAGTSTVTFTAVASIGMTQPFNNLTVTAGTATLAANTTVGAALTVTGGTLAKSTSTLSTTILTLSGGNLTSISGAGTVSGNMAISSVSSYVAFGSETWTIGGTWTNSSTSASWSAGTGTVSFRDGAPATMTFAGTNLAGDEFSSVTFDTSAVAGITYTMSTRGLRLGATLTIQNTAVGATGVTALDTSPANLAVTAGGLTLSTLGAFRAQGSAVAVNGNVTLSAGNAYMVLGSSVWTVTGTWTNASTSASWSAGTSAVTIRDAATGTLTFGNLPVGEFNNLTLDTSVAAGITYTMATNGLRVGGSLRIQNTVATPTGNTVLSTSGSNLAITAGTITIGTSGTLTANGSTITVSGNWTSTAAGATLAANTSTVVFNTAATIGLGAAQAFNILTLSAGSVTQGSQLTASSLNVNGGTLVKGTNPLTVNGNVSLGGGAITSTSGSVTITGNVSISSPASYIVFGSESWTIGGTWTNASTSASWAAGTGTVTFNPGASGIYTFGNLGGNEFNNVALSPTAAATFTMATNGLRWGGALTLNLNATLATSGLALTGGSLSIGNGATLTSNASGVSVSNVTMTGGTSGTLTLSTGSWTVGGNWDTSGAGSTFSPGTSSVTLTGVSKTVKLLTGQQFATLTASGTLSQSSDLKAASLTVSGTLTKTGFGLIFNALTATTGTIVDAAVSVTNFAVTDNDPTAYISVSVFTVWIANTQYAWTHTDSKATDTITFTIGGQTGVAFNVYKDGTWFTGGGIAGGNITFTMLGSDPNMVVNAAGCGGNSRYWVQGTGLWSQTSHWAPLSGGAGSCSVPGPGTSVFVDANSGAGTSTIDANSSIASLNTTGSSITTIALGTNSLSTSGNLTHAAGAITIGASAGTGLTVGGNLTLSGTAVLDGSAAASVVNVTGSLTVSSATAYLRMGSGTWTVSGTWTNASTSASWAPGTGTVLFNSAAAQTMTFAGTNLPGAEFNNVTFNSGASTITFSLASRGLTLAGLLTVQGGAGVTTLDLSAANLPLTSGDLTIGASGVLNGRGSMITLSGNWNSSLGTFTAGISVVVLSGATKTVNTTNPFASLTVSGSYTLASAVTAGATSVSGSLNTSPSNLALTLGDLTVTGTLTGNASAIGVSGNWDSHLGTFAAGTSTVTLSGAAKTVNTAGSFATLAVSGSYTMASAVTSGTTSVSGTLSTSASNFALSVIDLTVMGTLTANGSAIGVSGNWDSHLGTFAAGTSTATLSGTAKTVNTASSFGSLTVPGTYTMVSAVTAGATIVSGTLTTSALNYGLTVGNLTVTGTLTANGSAIGVSGNWDSHLGTFAAGTSTVTMSGLARTLDTASAFATLHVTGTVTLASAVTVGTALNVDTNGSLDTSLTNYAVNAVSLTVGATGTLLGEGSTLTVTSLDTHLGVFTVGTSNVVVNAAGGTVNVTQTLYDFTVNASVTTTISSNLTWSGGLTLNNADTVGVAGNLTSSGAAASLALNGAALTVSGNWDTSSTSGAFNGGTSVVILDGAAKTFRTAAGQTLNTVTASGTISLASDLRAASLVVTGTLTKTGFSLIFNALTDNAGAIADGAVGASNFSVTNSEATAFTTISVFSVWTTNVQYGWTHTSSSVTTTITFTITGVAGSVYNVTKDAVLFTSGSVVAGQVQFTMLGSDPVMLVTLSGCTGTDEYWVLGTGNWSDPAHWATSSGGVGGCPTPPSTMNVHADANSGTGTITVDVDVSIASLDTTGSTIGTLAIGTHNFATSGNVTHAAGTITIGSSAGTGLTVGGTLTLSGSAVLDGSGGASIVGVTGATNVSTVTAYVRMGSGTWTFGGSWTNSSTSPSWSAGTGTVLFKSGANATMTFGNIPGIEFNDVTFDTTAAAGIAYTMGTNPLRVGGTLLIQNSTASPTGNTRLVTSNLALAAGAATIGTNGTLSAGSSTITASGGWTATALNATFVAGTSTVSFAASGNVAMTQPFYNLTITAGTLTAGTDIAIGNALIVSGGTFAKSTFTLSAASLTLAGGALTSISGDTTITGSVNVSAAASYVAFGSETWSVGGSWTNTSISASWAVGTATVTFGSSSAQTMQFAALPATAPEFYNVEFNAGAAAVTFTMAGNALTWSGTLTVRGSTAITELATNGLGLTGGALIVGNAGALTASASSVSVASVAMTGGTSGSIVLTTGAWTVAGLWDTSGSGSALSTGTSTVTLTGASSSVHLAPGQAFHDLTVAGSVTALSAVTASAALTINATALLTTTGQIIGFNALTILAGGTLRDGTVSVTDLAITNSDPSNLTTVSVFSVWISDAEYTWTHASSVATSTLTFTIGGNSLGGRFIVTKDAAAFITNGVVDALGQVVFTMLGSDPVVDVIVAAPCGSSRYWVGGTGNWSDPTHWASVSGGVGGCSVPSAARSVFFDGASAGGLATVDGNATFASLDTAGWTGILAIGVFDVTVSGNIVHSGGTITVGASAGAGLTATGNLTLSASAVLDGSGAASLVRIDGNTLISSPTAYFRMGTGTWVFGGAWSNGSTSASWSAGTGTVLFTSASSQTMSFATLAGSEFYHVTFASAAASGAVVFTMATNPLRWSGTLTLQDAAGSSTTLATGNLALVGGSLLVGNGGLLLANASTATFVDVTMNAGVSGSIAVTTGAWTVSGDWDTTGLGSTFTKGTGSVTLTGSGRTVGILNAPNGFYNLTVSGTASLITALVVSGTLSIGGTLTTGGAGVAGGAALVASGGGSLIGTTSSISVGDVTMNDAGANVLSLTSGALTASGSWDTSGAASSFLPGTSTVTMTGASATVTLGASQTFANLVITGTVALGAPLAAATLTIPSGGLAKGLFSLTVSGDLTLSGGYLTAVSGSAIISGNVTIASASYLALGAGTWTVSGSWTNGSTSASWSAGTALVTFTANASQTMTFAGTNLAGNEFDAITFDGGSSTVTFTLSTNALVARAVTVRGGSGTTNLSTSGSNLEITADTLTVAAGGSLVANGSLLTVRSMDTSAGAFTPATSTVLVNASGGVIRIPQVLSSLTVNPGLTTTFASDIAWSVGLVLTGATVAFAGNLVSVGAAAIGFTGGVLTIAGSWDTSTAASLASLGSSVTFTGSGRTLAIGGGQQFDTLTIAGNVALASNLAARSLTVGASSSLTKTGYGITFNGFGALGTIVDGSVNATGLTVSNSDGTSFVTISLFTRWDVGSTYEWTHTSNATSQTITWTIAGNRTGDLYSVTKDGAAFASGAIDGSGEVVFTMLGSDPTMRVSVGPPPIPAWWQSPFVLSLPPIGLLMVVAMIAQRRRWKPAKAFLVDEHGQLLREFTLDPSCQVSYAEACEAGALDAQDKDVKVSKYHARAVVGDALAVVLLAYGPVNLQEVEFAREMLTNIQDKFETRVKDRLVEARMTEGRLEDRDKVLREGETDLHARSRVFGDMVNAFTIARSKLDNHASNVNKREADLTSNQTRLNQDRTSLDDAIREAESLRNSLEERKAELEKEEAELKGRADAVKARERKLAPQERTMADRESTLANTESGLHEKETALAAMEAKLTADTDALRWASTEHDRREQELSEERKALDELATQAQVDRTAHESRAKELEAREKEVAERIREAGARETSLVPREEGLTTREAELAAHETEFRSKSESLAAGEASLSKDREAFDARKAEMDARERDLAEEGKALDALTQDLDRRQVGIDGQIADLRKREAEVETRFREVETLKGHLGPRETAILEKEKALEDRKQDLATQETRFQDQTDLVAAKALEIQQQMETLREKEEAVARDRVLLNEARAAADSERKDFQSSLTATHREMQSRRDELDGQGRSLGEQQLRFAQEREEFEAMRAEKSQWIASKDIELESREQSLQENEVAVRGQAEENARILTDLAAREETLEIEGAKLDKARADLEITRSELDALGKELEAKAARGREEETRKADELRTWQSTLESEQNLLREQREAFDAEMVEVRESWAGRMLRVEQRDAELAERETKVQADVEWVARNEDEIAKRQRTADESMKAATALRAETERIGKELEQRAMEIESRERAVREDAASLSVELQKRTETLNAAEVEFAGRKAQTEQELASRADQLRSRDEELANRAQSLDGRLAELGGHETTLARNRDSLREEEARLAREHSDLQALTQQLEARQLELTQVKEQQHAEALRQQNEAEAAHRSLAAKEADLRSEQDRLERESASLQEKLGAKAQEMAAREKALGAREAELRSEEQDFEARVREIDSRDRQLQAHVAEAQMQTEALAQREKELGARSAQFDQTVLRFEKEAAVKRKDWEDLQTTLKTQEAQLAASTESRQSEISKRIEDLDHRERSLNATMTQLQLERSRLEGQARTLIAKEAEIAASQGRSDKRFTDLKAMEDDLLRSRQTFEGERANWAERRDGELKQLEMTRDAAAEQTQQSERLIEEAQRRAFMASEAEKAAKRQADELGVRQAQLETRRGEAEKAERELQARMAQFTEISQKMGTRENELDARSHDLESRQTKASAAERANATAVEELKARKAALDQEAERLAGLTAENDRRRTEDDARRASVEAKLAEITKRDQQLATELQRADNLMEDLARKEATITGKEKSLANRETEFSGREASLADKSRELMEGMVTLEKLKGEQTVALEKAEKEQQAAANTRHEAESTRTDAEKLKTQSESMQAEVSKNMRFLQKKALDVLDREEKVRGREVKADEESRGLEMRAQILDKNEKTIEGERKDLTSQIEKLRGENEKLHTKLTDLEKAEKPVIDMEEWKRDIDNRVKIIQRKALELLDREEKLRKREEDLRTLAEKLGVKS